MSLSAPDVVGEVSHLTASLSAMNVTPQAVSETPTLKGLSLLHHREVVNASGKIINNAKEFDCRLPQNAVGRVFALLNAPRSLNGRPLHLLQLFYSWHAYLMQLTPCLRLVGDDLYRLIGYEKLESDLVKLYSAENGNIENFVTKEVLQDLKARCSLPLNAITLRIYVKEFREIHNIAHHLQSGMIAFYGSGACSHVKQEDDHSRFSFTAVLNGQMQVIHIVVTTAASYATTASIAQITITPGVVPHLFEFKQGYQWVLDVTFKLLRLNSSGKNLTSTLIRHLREHEYPVEGSFEVLWKEQLAHVRKELQLDALLSLWIRLSDTFTLQNVFLLAGLVHRAGYRELAASFFLAAASQVPVSDGFWHRSFRLVQEENISYGDLAVLLQVFGSLFAHSGAIGTCRVERKSDLMQRLIFRPDGEFSLLLPLDSVTTEERASVLLSQLAGKQSFQDWLGYFIPKHQAKYEGTALPQIAPPEIAPPAIAPIVRERLRALSPSSFEGYFSHILLGNHEVLLRHFVPVVRQSEGALKQFFALFVKCALVRQNYPFPESFENGGLNSEGLEVEWIEYLLQSCNPAFRQIGIDLLCNLTGQIKLKSKWATYFLTLEPAFARRIIKTVESEVADPVMTEWLEKAPQPELFIFDILKSKLWDALIAKVRPECCLMACQTLFEKDAARAEKLLDSVIQQVNHTDQRIVPLLLKVSKISKNIAKWYFDGIKEAKFTASSDQAPFCRMLLRSYPEFLTKDHVGYIAKVHGASFDTLLDSSNKELQEIGALLASRSQSASPRTLKKLWHVLRQMLPDNFGAWNAAFIHCVQAIGEVFPPDKTELLPVLLHPEALQHVPQSVRRLLQEVQAPEFTHANRSHLHRLIPECMARGVACSTLISLVDTHVKFCSEPVLDAVKSELLQKLEKDDSPEMIVWYLAKVRAKFFTPRHMPVYQVRLLLRAFGACRSELTVEFCEHVRNLANVKEIDDVRGEIEQAKPADAQEFLKVFGPFLQVKEKPAAKKEPTPNEKIKLCIRYKKWNEASFLLLKHRGEREDAELVCRELTAQPTSQLFTLMQKYEVADLALWQAAFSSCEKANKHALIGEGIIALLTLKISLDTGIQLALWLEIIKKPKWICHEDAFAVFKELDYVRLVLRDAPNQEEINLAIGTLIEEFIIALGSSSKRNEYLKYAHCNLETLVRDPAEYFRLGLTLLSYSETYADTVDFVRDCKLFERMLGHLQTVITSVYELVTRAVSQQKRTTQPRSVRLERFYGTCRAFFKMAHCRIAESDAIAALTSLVTKMSEISFIDQLLIEILACFPALEVRQALVQPLKRKLADCLFRVDVQAPNSETLQGIRHLLTNLLVQGSDQTLKQIYHCCAGQKRVSNFQHRDLLQLLEGSCGRYFGIILASVDAPDFFLALDVALVLRKSVPNFPDTIVELILRIIERSGWNGELKERVEEFCQQNFTQNATEQYVCTMSNVVGERFYQSASALHDESIGTLVPFVCKREEALCASEQQFLQLSNQLIGMSIKKAALCTDSGAKARLLDVAAEAIRVNLERYPHDVLLPTHLLNLSIACSSEDTLLYPVHCKIAFTLIKRAFQKGIIQQSGPGLDLWLEHLNRRAQDLSPPPNLRGVLELQQSIFLLGTSDGFSEQLLIASEQMLLSLQEAFHETELEQRESLLRDILRVWRDHPAILCNLSIKQSMEMLLCPNSHFFGCDMGAKGKQHAKRCASMYLDTLSFMFSKQTTQLSKQSCARYIIESTMEAKRYHAFDGDEDAFLNHAKRLLDLLGVCDTEELVILSAKCLLLPTLEAETHAKMRLLKQSLVPYIQKYDPKMKNGILNAVRQEVSK